MDTHSKKLLLIFNPKAGRSKPRGPLFDALALLSENGYLVRIHRTTAAGDAAETAAREGGDYDLVVASGGDGTLNEVISGLSRLEHPPLLGYLPQGSTNDFAASLRIPGDPEQAAAAIVQQRVQVLDIGQWNQRCFAYVASFGAFTKTSYSAPQAAKNALGHFAYILEGMKDLNSLRPYRVKITADGETLDGEYLFGAVCNSTSIGGLMKLDPGRVVLDDGKFELLLIPNPKNAMDLQNLVMDLLNQNYDGQGLIFRHVSQLHLETKEDLPWSLDGEYAPSVPAVDIVNCRGALRMLL
ncbi:diacylglycerol/lipid kinase family protein [Dysosmobacter sp.]|uniref:diacylglycerol/lipid kinase family protein n=1 Tax=Dysosmobacter sp. TaxID=2591382 RepID=UPI002A929B84|nr:diacylglycerol kinase family protein [Dysosmobacter sp.]MCI6053989.1 diacylglycerol kinase family lipid kinase [Dysosmobacter sp.]MDY5509892.1 diacylglycerol kinase family lipid kinase [Dysosmobacter sp.]